MLFSSLATNTNQMQRRMWKFYTDVIWHVIVKWCRDAVNYEKCTCLWKARDLEGIRTVGNDRIYQRRGCCVWVSTFRYLQFLWVWNQCSVEFVLKNYQKCRKKSMTKPPPPGKFFCKPPTLPILAALKNGSKPTPWLELVLAKVGKIPTGGRWGNRLTDP